MFKYFFKFPLYRVTFSLILEVFYFFTALFSRDILHLLPLSITYPCLVCHPVFGMFLYPAVAPAAAPPPAPAPPSVTASVFGMCRPTRQAINFEF